MGTAAGIFNLHEQVSQAEGNCVQTATALRRLGNRDPEAMANMARILGVWSEKDPTADAPMRAAEYLERTYARHGFPTSVGQLGIPRSSIDGIMANGLNNDNSDPDRDFIKGEGLLKGNFEAAR